jgi:hypothetical protein
MKPWLQLQEAFSVALQCSSWSVCYKTSTSWLHPFSQASRWTSSDEKQVRSSWKSSILMKSDKNSQLTGFKSQCMMFSWYSKRKHFTMELQKRLIRLRLNPW